MFEALTEKLSGVFNKLTSRGVLSEADVDTALREIRIALLEADVSLPVARELIAKIKEEATGEKLVKSISPGQLVVKIVHDKLLEVLGDDDNSLNLNAKAPVVILMAGLQGSGKTTTAAKIAKRLKDKQNKKILLASLDIYRPAAQEQLQTLANQINGHSLEIIKNQKPLDIAKRALEEGKKKGFDVVILDSAGRLQIDDTLMNELIEVKNFAKPTEVLLVSDAMIGQEACNVAKAFNEAVGVTGIVLTRVDGSARAGAALSMKMVANVPIKFLGVGEKLSEIEEFHPERLAGRILGQGDVVTLVERAMDNIDKDEAEKLAAKMSKGKFDLNDMLSQLTQMQKLGSMSSIMGLIPGLSKFKDQIETAGADDMVKKQVAIILSMTKQERKNPDIIKASRKKRIAAGSGVEVHEVNKLIKAYEQMARMTKQMGKLGGMQNMLKQVNNIKGIKKWQ